MTTRISWATETWNPTTGCSHVSEGCRWCYAETLSLRRGWSAHPWTENHAAENVKLHPDRLRKPYTWKKPSRVFVDSMSDLFHPQVPDDFIAQVFAVMADLPQHTFQILTKRPERMSAWPGPWPAHVWAGTSVEDERVLHRVDQLRALPAQVRFLSCEPLLGPLPGLDLSGISWVIVGGESGSHLREDRWRHRWMRSEWAREIRDACVDQGVAFFFKQSSGPRSEMGTALKEADGSERRWQQYPTDLAPPERVG